MDGDDDLDAIFASAGANFVCFKSGGAFISCAVIDEPEDRYFSFAVATGDVDGDGNVDAVFSNDDDEPHRVCLGDGTGGFSCTDLASETGETFSSVALGFVDGDAKLDAVIADGESNRVCRGTGLGTFDTCHDVDSVSGRSEDVALGDVNTDGLLDAIFAVNSGRSRYCLGDGATGFVCHDLPMMTGRVNAVAAGYIDGDGALDLAFANSDTGNSVCLGDGAGVFSCVVLSSENVQTSDVAIIPAYVPPNDVDGDGVVDAEDVCPDTESLGSTTPSSWNKNRFWPDTNGLFVSGDGASSGFTMVDTGGCDGLQIIEDLGLGRGQLTHGLSVGVLESWVASITG